MKTEILNVRVTRQMNNLLIADSSNKEITISDNIRIILSDYFGLNQNLINQNSFESKNDFYNSNEFIYLVAWMFDKKGRPQIDCEKQKLIELQNIISTVTRIDILTPYLKAEFSNVLADLNRVINENYTKDKQFRFCKLYENDTFDYLGFLDHLAYEAFTEII
jgi:hypothetical protein